jgi:hypothetical protein
MFLFCGSKWRVRFPRILLVSRRLFQIIHSTLRDWCGGKTTWYEGSSSSDTHSDPFGASLIICSTPRATHSTLQRSKYRYENSGWSLQKARAVETYNFVTRLRNEMHCGRGKLLKQSTSMNTQCFWSKLILLSIIRTRITGENLPGVLRESPHINAWALVFHIQGHIWE